MLDLRHAIPDIDPAVKDLEHRFSSFFSFQKVNFKNYISLLWLITFLHLSMLP